MKKSTKVMAASAFVFGLAIAGSGAAHAALATNTLNPTNNVVNAIAQKFNLNAADVQKVFDEQHTQMKAQHAEMQKVRLAQAVTAGKLTQAQADLILAKKAELEASREANRSALEGKTQVEREVFMKTQAENIKAWLTANNIPQEYMMGFDGGHGDKGRGGERSFGGHSNKTIKSGSSTNK